MGIRRRLEWSFFSEFANDVAEGEEGLVDVGAFFTTVSIQDCLFASSQINKILNKTKKRRF